MEEQRDYFAEVRSVAENYRDSDNAKYAVLAYKSRKNIKHTLKSNLIYNLSFIWRLYSQEERAQIGV